MFIKIKPLLLTIILSVLCRTAWAIQESKPKVYVFANNSKHYENIKNSLNAYNINYELTDSIAHDDKNLYIIFDVFNIASSDLPKHYIAYQSLDLRNYALTNDYAQKLSSAIAVWDYSFDNINQYRSRINNYYYFPKNYEYADPVILPCNLPVATLNAYKEILSYSNQVNGDISSHLPAIFCYTVLQNPDILVEAGVRNGQSTIAFKKALDFCNAQFVALDLEPYSGNAYPEIKNSRFLCMNDLDYPDYCTSDNTLKNHKHDLIFIDTSHYYDHTVDEITKFVPILSDRGMLLFHDTHMSPLPSFAWKCINGEGFSGGWDNKKGVIRAIKNCFSISYDETKYNNFEFEKDGITWNLVHYPYCNGLTMIKKLNK